MAGTLLAGEEKLVAPSGRENVSSPGSWPGGRFERPMTRELRRMLGRGLRSEVPRSSHAVWDPPAGRTDPVERLTATASGGSRSWCRSGTGGC